MKTLAEVIRHQVELCKYKAMLAVYDREVTDAPPGTAERAAAWRDRTAYAALNHPDHPPAWMDPAHPNFRQIPQSTLTGIAQAAGMLAQLDAGGTRIAQINGHGPEHPDFAGDLARRVEPTLTCEAETS